MFCSLWKLNWKCFCCWRLSVLFSSLLSEIQEHLYEFILSILWSCVFPWYCKKTATVNLIVCYFIQVIKCPVLLVYVMGYRSSYLQQYCVSYLSADISKSSVGLSEQPGTRPKASGGARLSGAEQPTRLRRCRVTKQTLNHRRGRGNRKTSSKLSQCFLIHTALKLQI